MIDEVNDTLGWERKHTIVASLAEGLTQRGAERATRKAVGKIPTSA